MNLSRLFSRENQDKATWTTFFLAMLINTLFIVYYEFPFPGDPTIENSSALAVIDTLNVFQTVVAVFVLLLSLVVRTPVIYQSFTARENLTQLQTLLYTATDAKTMYYFVYLLLSLLGLLVADYFLPFLLLDIVAKNATTRDVLNAVVIPRKQLIMTVILAIFVSYIFAYFIFIYFPGDLGGIYGIGIEPGNQDCHSLWGCFKFVLSYGLRQGGGVGDVMNLSIGTRWLIDTAYFLVVIVMMLNIIFGIIIDTFSSLRNDKNFRLLDTTELCFICGIDKQIFDRASDEPDGFKNHIKLDHNMWNYLYFIFMLWEQDKDDDDGMEQYVRRAIDANEITWFPLNKAIRLDQAASDEEITLQQISNEIVGSELAFNKKLDELQVEISALLEQISQATKNDFERGFVKNGIADYLRNFSNMESQLIDDGVDSVSVELNIAVELDDESQGEPQQETPGESIQKEDGMFSDDEADLFSEKSDMPFSDVDANEFQLHSQYNSGIPFSSSYSVLDPPPVSIPFVEKEDEGEMLGLDEATSNPSESISSHVVKIPALAEPSTTDTVLMTDKVDQDGLQPTASEPVENLATQPEIVAKKPEPSTTESKPTDHEPELTATEHGLAFAEPDQATVEPESISKEPEPISKEPEPNAIEPEPNAAEEPEPTLKEPESSAAQPEPASDEPEPISKEPEPNAIEPEPNAAEEPEPTLKEPESSAAQPEPASDEPEPISKEPEPNAIEPEPISKEPEPTSEEPESSATQPDPASEELELVAKESESNAFEPEPTSDEPEPNAFEPEPTSDEPEPSAVDPEATLEEPEPTSEELEPMSKEPESSATQPEPASEEPEPISKEPRPNAFEREPTSDEPEPNAIDPEATFKEPEPTSKEPEQAAVEPEPISIEPEPNAAKPEPTLEEPEPTSEEPESTSEEPKPSGAEPELTSSVMEASAAELESIASALELTSNQPKHAVVESEPAAIEPKPAALEAGATSFEPEPTVNELEHTASKPGSASTEPEPIASNPQSFATEPEPGAADPESTASEPEPFVTAPEPAVAKPAAAVIEPEPNASESSTIKAAPPSDTSLIRALSSVPSALPHEDVEDRPHNEDAQSISSFGTAPGPTALVSAGPVQDNEELSVDGSHVSAPLKHETTGEKASREAPDGTTEHPTDSPTIAPPTVDEAVPKVLLGSSLEAENLEAKDVKEDGDDDDFDDGELSVPMSDKLDHETSQYLLDGLDADHAEDNNFSLSDEDFDQIDKDITEMQSSRHSLSPNEKK